MIVHALALVLASAPAADASTTLAVKVVSLRFSYPYFGEPGNTCQRGNVFVHAVADSQTPVVVRLVDSSGLTPGSEAVLHDVRRAGKGRDGTAVYCAAGRLLGAAAPVPVQPAAPGVEAQPPLVQAEPVAPAVEPSQPAPAPAVEPTTPAAGSRCTSRLFNVIKKPLAEKKFGPSEFDAESALGAPEVVDCSLARSRVTNVLLVRLVKDGFPKPEAVVGAEWGPGSTWQRDPDAPQRRVVKVYLVESP
ncbi:MAG: hypothetical protein Q8L48_39265 [Archangium sp.]|nr:hypothetical protein [Archangium sp.]